MIPIQRLLALGVGLAYRLNPHLRATTHWNHFRSVASRNINFFSAGIEYNFGRRQL